MDWGIGLPRNSPPPDADPKKALYDLGKAVLGAGAGGLVTRLLTFQAGDIAKAMDALTLAATKSDPREYIGRVIRPRGRHAGYVDPGL